MEHYSNFWTFEIASLRNVPEHCIRKYGMSKFEINRLNGVLRNLGNSGFELPNLSNTGLNNTILPFLIDDGNTTFTYPKFYVRGH